MERRARRAHAMGGRRRAGRAASTPAGPRGSGIPPAATARSPPTAPGPTAPVGLARGWDGDAAWTPERRFGRLWERLALPGFHRSARFDLLVTAGRLGVVPTAADGLHLGGTDSVTTAAKRVFGIGDPACSTAAPATSPRPP